MSRPRATHGPAHLAAPVPAVAQNTLLSLCWVVRCLSSLPTLVPCQGKAHCSHYPTALLPGAPAGTGAGLGAGRAGLPWAHRPSEGRPGTRHTLQTCQSSVPLGSKACVQVGSQKQNLTAGVLGVGSGRPLRKEAGAVGGRTGASWPVMQPHHREEVRVASHPPPALRAPMGFSSWGSRRTRASFLCSAPHSPDRPHCMCAGLSAPLR